MMMPRKINIDDADAIKLLMEQLGYPISKQDMENRIECYLKNEAYRAYVIEVEKKVVACASIALVENFHRINHFARITALIVDEHHRNLGLGGTLIKHIEKVSQALGCSHLEVSSGLYRTSSGTHQFYQKMGFDDLSEMKKYFARKVSD